MVPVLQYDIMVSSIYTRANLHQLNRNGVMLMVGIALLKSRNKITHSWAYVLGGMSVAIRFTSLAAWIPLGVLFSISTIHFVEGKAVFTWFTHALPTDWPVSVFLSSWIVLSTAFGPYHFWATYNSMSWKEWEHFSELIRSIGMQQQVFLQSRALCFPF